jgi:hypothetical protein
MTPRDFSEVRRDGCSDGDAGDKNSGKTAFAG